MFFRIMVDNLMYVPISKSFVEKDIKLFSFINEILF